MPQINVVALVDDDNLENKISISAIERSRLAEAIKVFETGKEAIDFLIIHAKIPSDLPEILILELQMQGMSALEFLEEFSKFELLLCKKIHIYIMASPVSAIDLEHIKKRSEVSGHVIKPITREKFESIVRSMK